MIRIIDVRVNVTSIYTFSEDPKYDIKTEFIRDVGSELMWCKKISHNNWTHDGLYEITEWFEIELDIRYTQLKKMLDEATEIELLKEEEDYV